jgi:hypothetical protein
MNWLHDYADNGERAYFRPVGNTTAGELSDMTTAALERAHRHGCMEALIDVTRVYGFESPGPAYRRWIVRRWAQTVLCEIAIVVLCRDDQLLEGNPGLVAAMAEGLLAHVCTTEDEAIAWLDAFTAVRH